MVRYIICSFLFVLLYPTAIDLYLVGLPRIADDLGADTAQLHYAFSIYLAGMATTMWLAGKMADRIGRKPVVIAGAINFVVASVLAASASEPMLFFLARFGQGIGAGAAYVVAFAVLRDKLEEQQRAKVLSMLNGITCVLPVLAPVAGHLIMLKFPWQSLFFAMAAMGAVVAVAAVFLFKESLPAKTQGSESLHRKGIDDRLLACESLRHPQFLSRVLMSSIAMIIILTYVNVSPMLIMGEMGFSRGEYSMVMTTTAMLSMATSFISPILIARFAPSKLILGSQGLYLLSASLLLGSLWLPYGEQLKLIAFGFISIGFSVGFGVIISQALSPFQRRAGAASSAMAVAQVCSAAGYIWLMGLLGVSPLMMLAGLLALGALVSIVVMNVPPSAEMTDDQTAVTTGS